MEKKPCNLVTNDKQQFTTKKNHIFPIAIHSKTWDEKSEMISFSTRVIKCTHIKVITGIIHLLMHHACVLKFPFYICNQTFGRIKKSWFDYYLSIRW